MNTTKTDLRYRLGLPRAVMAELERHARSLKGRRRESELLFPSKRAGLMSRSALDKPFRAVSRAIGLPFAFSPRGMRRTYQDLGRAAGIEKDVRKAICGHATDEMSELYSTVRPDEMAGAVAKILRSVTRRAA
jgi:integrase